MNRFVSMLGLWLGMAAAALAGGVVSDCDEASLHGVLKGGGLVTFACDGLIRLSQPVVISVDTVVDGTGREVTMSGEHATRVFEVRPGVTLRLVRVTVAQGAALEGGGVLSEGAILVLDQCVFSGNTAAGPTGAAGAPGGDARGGAVLAVDSTVTVSGCVFSNNVAIGGVGGSHELQAGQGGNASGGALCVVDGWLTIGESTFVANTATGGVGGAGNPPGEGGRALGGSIFTSADTAGLAVTSITASQARGGQGGAGGTLNGPVGAGHGGGLYAAAGGLRINGCTVSDCEAAGSRTRPARGGGIANLGSILAYNLTVASNYTTMTLGGDSLGGGVYNEGTLTTEFCTLAANAASGNSFRNGGNLHNEGGVASLRGTAIAYCMVQWDVVGPVIDRGYNICWDPSARLTNATSLDARDPKLGPLAWNGGPVRTMIPLPGSPIIDLIPGPEALTEDARGFPRPQGSAYDIGAVEGQAMAPQFEAIFQPRYVSVGSPATLRITVRNPNDFPLEALSFNWRLPGWFQVAPLPIPSAACGGVPLATPGTDRVGARFPWLGARQECVVEIPVASAVPGDATLQPGTSVCTNLGTLPSSAVPTTVGATTQPVAITLPVQKTPAGSFVLRGLAYPIGRPGAAFFDWGPNGGSETTTQMQIIDGRAGEVAIEAELEGLAPATGFHGRLVVTDGATAAFGEAQTFATPSAGGWTALSFDGLDDWVNVPQGFAALTNTFTIECWAWPTAGQARSAETTVGIAAERPLRLAIYPSEGSRRYGPGHVGVGLSIGTNGVCVFEHGQDLLAPVAVFSTHISTWTHVAVVYDGPSSPRLFLDGQMVRAGLRSTNVAHPSMELSSTGDARVSGLGFFQGSLDEVRVWSRALPTEEILARSGRALSGNESGLEACLALNEGADTNLLDLTGHGYHGELRNRPSWIPSFAPIDTPRVVTLDPEAIQAYSATLRAWVNPNGRACRFLYEWGATVELGHRTPIQELSAEAQPATFSTALVGLRPGHSFYFQPILEFAGGAWRGELRSFFTDYGANDGKALRLEGNRDSIQGGARFPEITNTFTMEFWARPTVGRAITGEGNGGVAPDAGQNFAFYPQIGSIAYGGLHAVAGVSVGTNGISVFEHSDNYRPSPLVYDTSISSWVHIAVVYTNSLPSLYLNGVLVRQGLATSRPVHPSADLGNASATLGSGVGQFIGELDEVRVWSVARSADEILLNRGRKLPATEPGLILRYSFDAGPGPTVADESLRAEPGTVVGNPVWVPSGAWVESPFVLAAAVQSAGADRVTLSATVNPFGHLTQGYFEWGPTPTYGNVTPPVDLGQGEESVPLTADLTGLSPGTLYHFRAVLESEGRFVIGPGQTFHTGLPGSGTALQFDGTNDFVSSPPAFAQVRQDFTMEVWAQPDREIRLYEEGPWSGIWPESQRFAIFPLVGSAAYGDGHAEAGISIGTNGVIVVEHAGSYAPVVLGAAVRISGWTHVAVVYQAGRPSLFINGSFVRTGLPSTKIVHPGSALGASGAEGSAGYYSGLLDEVRVWSVARTAEEIQSFTHHRLADTEPNLVRLWRLDEGGGSGIRSAVAAEDTGTRFEAAWIPSEVPLDRAYLIEDRVVSANPQATEIEFTAIGNTFGGSLHVEWGAGPDLGSTTAPATVAPGSQNQAFTFRLGGPDPGVLLYYRTVLTTGGAAIPGSLRRVVIVPPGGGAALQFDGINDEVIVEPAPFQDLGRAFTMEFWCWPAAGRDSTVESGAGAYGMGAQRFAVYPSHGPTVYGPGWATAGISVGANGVSLVEHGDSFWVSVIVHNQALVGWNHVAVVYSNAVPRLFLNGIQVREGVYSNQQIRPGYVLGGGPDVLGTTTHYKGLLDEVRVWNRPLTGGDIQAIMHWSLDRPMPGLAWELRLDEGWGTTSRDSVIRTRQGQLLNGVTWIPSDAPTVLLQPVSSLPGDALRLQFATAPVRTFVLQQSADLAAWDAVTTNASSIRGVFEFTVPGITNHPRRFYRLVSP